MEIAEGEEVYVYYRAQQMSQSSVYMAVIDPRHGAYRPRTGLTEGWVSATAKKREGEYTVVRFSWPHFYEERGRASDPDDPNGEFYFKNSDVRPASEYPSPPLFFMPGGYRPKLSIISFRWGGTNQIVVPEQWGHTGSSCSSVFMESFIESAVVPRVGRNYEVWSVFVEDSTDLAKIADTAHLIFGPQHPARRAEHVCAMYFIYPTSFEENCVPTAETGEDEGAAHVDQKSLFRMMQAVEKCGIPTQFPHSAGFYELLTSKRWTHMMTLTPHLRVPPTVALPRMLIEKDIGEASSYALKALQAVKKQQAVLRNEDLAKADQPIEKGVAKLGFSWEALDVKFWSGEDGLQTALHQLTQVIEISGHLTGQPHDCESLLIQEYCPHDIELRLYVVNGVVEGRIYTKFCKIKPNNEFGDFQQHFEPEPVAAEWMGGDRAALDDGERQCREITAHWMTWVQAQICDIPPGIRFDYFIGRTPEKGKAVVWTLEICELGFSMLGEPDLPRKVFEAMFHHCMDKTLDGAVGVADKRPKVKNDPVNTQNASPKTSPKQGPAADAASPKSENGNGKGKGKAVEAASEILYINVPRGSKFQQDCTGTYQIESDRVNGLPVWKKTGAGPKRWIYNAKIDEYWYVGDDDEKKKNFNCNEGYIRCHGRAMPYELSDPWTIFDEEDDEWIPDQSIIVALEADALDAKPQPQGGQGGTKGGRRGGKGKRR